MIGCCEGEVCDCGLKSYWVICFSNMLWDHFPDANCSGVKGECCSVDAHLVAMYWPRFFDGFNIGPVVV